MKPGTDDGGGSDCGTLFSLTVERGDASDPTMTPLTEAATGLVTQALSRWGAAVEAVLSRDGVRALLAVALASVHFVAGRVGPDRAVPRRRFLSVAGGVSVAYVFVHVLPELGHTSELVDREPALLGAVEEHVYVVALLGFLAYYGLERLAQRSADAADGEPGVGVFRVHVGSFGLYNAIIGYLLFHRETPGLESLLLYAVAIGLHLVVVDYGMQDRHREAYLSGGRWLLAAAVLAGAVVGAATELDRARLGLLFAFVAGGIVLNVIKEELPAERDSSFAAFAGGVAGYTALLLAV